MYFQECDHLAGEYPGLKEIIFKIDNEILHSTEPSSVFRTDDIASYLQEKSSQISGIFNILSERGLLREEEYIECPNCSNLIPPEDYKKAIDDQDSFECTQCQIDLAKLIPDEIKVYRLNPAKIHIINHEEEPLAGTLIPDSKGFDQELPLKIIDDPFRNTPLLRYYSRNSELLEEKPFENKRVFFVLHFLKDLLPFVNASVNLGLDMRNAYFFYKDYPYPQKNAIIRWLEQQGAIVKPRSYIPQYIKQLAESPPENIGKILIIEDGGFFVPEIHRDFPQIIPNVIGAVEQTTRGIRNAQNWENDGNKLKFPIISVATSRLKSDFEPIYIGRAVIDNIKQMLPSMALNGKTAALFGFGTIGREIAEWLNENNVNVTIFEPTSYNRVLAQQKGFNLDDSSEHAAKNRNFVIGASGNESINSQVIASLSHGTYLISASSELYEINIDELDKQARNKEILINDNDIEIGTTYYLPPNDRQIHVLANGYPINFWGFESMPEEASDLILSLIFLSASEMALENFPTTGINSEAVNQLAEKYQIDKKFLEFHKQG